ncbi:hypothetical protein [Streptomyces sp. NPDC002758]
MGERQSDGGLPDRPHVHPGGTLSGPPRPHDDATSLEARFAAALRTAPVAPEAEQRAVAAFRDARDAGAHRARTRRRDDWRPREPWRARLSVKTALSVLLASVTLGGVAVAAIGGSSSGGSHDDQRRAHPSTSAPQRSSAGASAESSAHPDRPDTAKDTLAKCRSYEQVRDQGKALDSTAWQRLVTAAGGEKNVAAYCAAQLASADGQNNGRSSGQNNGQGSAGNSGQNNGRSSTQNSGKGTKSGNSAENTQKTDGNQ